VPLFGSTPTNGTGMNGAVAGLNHRVSQLGLEAGGGIGPCGGACVGSFPGESAQEAVAIKAASSSQRADRLTQLPRAAKPETR
jgi:hypothetical protein